MLPYTIFDRNCLLLVKVGPVTTLGQLPEGIGRFPLIPQITHTNRLVHVCTHWIITERHHEFTVIDDFTSTFMNVTT